MEKVFIFFQRLCYMWILLLCATVGSNDPCDDENHQLFPQDNFGSRNEVCDPKITPICDYYLTEKWYVVENATIRTSCPVTGNCGVAYPAWMAGGFPRIEDGEVNQTACIKMDGDCCKRNVTLTIKNCDTFYVFYLSPLPACPMAYCFESDLPCDPPTTPSTEGTTASKGLYTKTTGGQRTPDDDKVTTGKRYTLWIGIGAGITGLILGVLAVVSGWLMASGRCKSPSTLKTRQEVAPHNYINQHLPYKK